MSKSPLLIVFNCPLRLLPWVHWTLLCYCAALHWVPLAVPLSWVPCFCSLQYSVALLEPTDSLALFSFQLLFVHIIEILNPFFSGVLSSAGVKNYVKLLGLAPNSARPCVDYSGSLLNPSRDRPCWVTGELYRKLRIFPLSVSGEAPDSYSGEW